MFNRIWSGCVQKGLAADRNILTISYTTIDETSLVCARDESVRGASSRKDWNFTRLETTVLHAVGDASINTNVLSGDVGRAG